MFDHPSLLVASDLDGTLLTSEHRVTARARAAAAAVCAAGGEFIVVTARPLRDAVPIATAVGATGLVCCGGGVVFDLATNRVTRTATFVADDAVRVMMLLRAALPDVRVGIEYLDRCEHDFGFDLRQAGSADLAHPGCVEVAGEPVVKVIAQSATVPTDDLAIMAREAFAAAGHCVGVSMPCSAFVSVEPVGVDKASHLVRITERLACQPTTIAFGDMPSDLPMLRWARTGVAVANAHPVVLAAADDTTESNDDDGVATYLERFLAAISGG